MNGARGGGGAFLMYIAPPVYGVEEGAAEEDLWKVYLYRDGWMP